MSELLTAMELHNRLVHISAMPNGKAEKSVEEIKAHDQALRKENAEKDDRIKKLEAKVEGYVQKVSQMSEIDCEQIRGRIKTLRKLRDMERALEFACDQCTSILVGEEGDKTWITAEEKKQHFIDLAEKEINSKENEGG